MGEFGLEALLALVERGHGQLHSDSLMRIGLLGSNVSVVHVSFGSIEASSRKPSAVKPAEVPARHVHGARRPYATNPIAA
jgi:hypothetical protein